VAGRSRTCGASRFRRPLYRTELRPQVDGRGWTRTSSLLFVRQALSALELLAHFEAPGQGLEPRPPRSERGVLAVRRSRKETIGCSCHSPTLRPWIAAASPLPHVIVEAFWSPALVLSWKMRRQKQPLDIQRQLPLSSGRGPFSLGRGLDVVLGFLQAGHHLVVIVVRPQRRGRPSRVALASSCYAARDLAEAPPSEGRVIVGPQQAEWLLPARRAGRDIGRGRAEHLDFGVSDLH
jgi:hypothetical protein